MSYAAQDHSAAVSDLIAFDGRLIEVGGRKYRAHIEPGIVSAQASEFGLDNREETLSATIVNRGKIPSFDDRVLISGKKYRITEMEPTGENVLTLSLTND